MPATCLVIAYHAVRCLPNSLPRRGRPLPDAASCRGRGSIVGDEDLGYFKDHLLAIEYPDVETPADAQTLETQAPFSLITNPPREFRPITLQDAVQTALRTRPCSAMWADWC